MLYQAHTGKVLLKKVLNYNGYPYASITSYTSVLTTKYRLGVYVVRCCITFLKFVYYALLVPFLRKRVRCVNHNKQYRTITYDVHVVCTFPISIDVRIL